jgi:hypothetical protein
MNLKFSRQLAAAALLGATAIGVGTAITRADTPGFLFMDINNNQALVVQPPKDQTTARIFKQPAKVTGNLAAAIAAGAQPVGDSVILAYEGKLYILPDKKINMGGEHMASHMVMTAAGAPGHGD